MTAVTGGAGFVGSHLVELLVSQGATVRVIEKTGSAIDHLPKSVDVVFADIRDPRAIAAALRGATHVYHLAADPNLWAKRRGHFHEVNYRGTVHVLEAALAGGAARILHCSTESILTRPDQHEPIAEDQVVPPRAAIGPYCRSKFLAERFAFRLAASKAPIVIANPTLPIGPGDRGLSPPSRMIRDCARGLRSIYLDADLNLIDVRDVALGLERALNIGAPGRRYLLGAEDWSVKRVFECVAKSTGAAPPRHAVPYAVALLAAYAGEVWADAVTGVAPAATVTGVKLARRRMRFDASRTWAALGMTPQPVQPAIHAAIRWLQTERQC